jgi:hypothetical protein
LRNQRVNRPRLVFPAPLRPAMLSALDGLLDAQG